MSENLNKKPPKGILKQSSSFDTNSKSSSNSFSTPRCSITSLGGAVGPVDLAAASCVLPEDEELPLSPSNRKTSKCAKFDEMNILETLHPADKDYGHMKIEEPKTPFNYYEDGEEDLQGAGSSSSSQHKKPHEILIDPEELAKKIVEKGVDLPSFMSTVAGASGADDDKSDDEDEDDMDPESKAKKILFETKRKAHYNEYFAVKLARQLMDKDGDEEEVEGGSKFIPEEETEVANDEEEEQEVGGRGEGSSGPPEEAEMTDVTNL